MTDTGRGGPEWKPRVDGLLEPVSSPTQREALPAIYISAACSWEPAQLCPGEAGT